jgi:hypothetical protein
MQINAKKRARKQDSKKHGPDFPDSGDSAGAERRFPAAGPRRAIVPAFLVLIPVLALWGCSKAAAPAGGRAAMDYEAGGTAAYSTGRGGAGQGTGFNPEGAAERQGRDAGFKETDAQFGADGVPEDPRPETNSPGTEKSRKLVKSARIRAQVDNLEEAAALVEAALERYQGYASESSVYDTSRHYTLKIPGAYYEAARREFGNIGKILHQSETAEDVTLRYYDLDGRLNTRLELLKTFQAYLGKAETIEDIMTVETRIAELQAEIDWYGSQLAELSHLVDYATISLELLGPASESVYYRPSLGDRIGELFRSFSGAASTALVILLGMFIYGIPALCILMLLFWLLFGRIGLIRRIWRLVAVKKGGNQEG